jgi:hypothetical protein
MRPAWIFVTLSVLLSREDSEGWGTGGESLGRRSVEWELAI